MFGTTDTPMQTGWQLESASGVRPIVLMVEDDPDHGEIYGSVLLYNGFNVILARDGASALRVASFLRPDLVLLDIGLPDVSGLELCRALRGAYQDYRLPVIALSGRDVFEMEASSRAVGCGAYLQKPVSPVRVLHAVEEILGQAPAPGEDLTPWMIQFKLGQV